MKTLYSENTLRHTLPSGKPDTERLGVTIFASLVAHIIIILGVGFSLPTMSSQLKLGRTLEILLVNSANHQRTDQADFIARHDNLGGGTADTVAQSPLPFEADIRERPASQPASASPSSQPLQNIQAIETSPYAAHASHSDAAPPGATTESTPQNTADSVQSNPDSERRRLIAQINHRWQEYQKRPRHTFLSPNMKSDIAANYIANWREQIERVGNSNYPDRARREGLSAELIVDVAINANGSLHRVDILKRSDYPFLNDAAVQFIDLASPFAPFPEELRANSDIIHITRAFRFLNGELELFQ